MAMKRIAWMLGGCLWLAAVAGAAEYHPGVEAGIGSGLDDTGGYFGFSFDVSKTGHATGYEINAKAFYFKGEGEYHSWCIPTAVNVLWGFKNGSGGAYFITGIGSLVVWEKEYVYFDPERTHSLRWDKAATGMVNIGLGVRLKRNFHVRMELPVGFAGDSADGGAIGVVPSLGVRCRF
jgi:hypothetical protein